LLIDYFGEVLHQADHVAHAQDSTGHAFWPKLLKLVTGLAHTGKHHRSAGDLLDAQCGAAACVTVELGKDSPRQFKPLVEGARSFDRVLADHGINHEV